MPHDQVGVEAQSSIDGQLPLCSRQQRGQPASFPRVHQQEDDVMRLHHLLQLLHSLLHLRPAK